MSQNYDDVNYEKIATKALNNLQPPCEWKSIYQQAQKLTEASMDPHNFLLTLSDPPFFKQTENGQYMSSNNLFSAKNTIENNTENRKNKNNQNKNKGESSINEETDHNKLSNQILNELNKDGTQSFRDLEDKFKVSATTISKRIEKLKERGVLTGISADINREKLGYKYTSIIRLKVNSQSDSDALNFLEKLPGLTHMYELTGDYDLLVISHYQDQEKMHTSKRKIHRHNAIREINTSVVLNVIKNFSKIPEIIDTKVDNQKKEKIVEEAKNSDGEKDKDDATLNDLKFEEPDFEELLDKLND